MCKKQLLHATIEVEIPVFVNQLPLTILNLYADSHVIRIYMTRLSFSTVLTERIIIR